jgi:hypothetical protein
MVLAESWVGRKEERNMADSFKSAAGDVLDLTGRLVDRLGPRIFGSASCKRAADEIATELRRHCDRVGKERFAAHPGSVLVPSSPPVQ